MEPDKGDRQWLRTVLYSIGDAVITTDTAGLVREMNPVAEALTGWPEAEAAGRAFSDVFVARSEATGAPLADIVAHVLRSGIVVGLANHTVLLSRDGTARPIADSAAPIRSADRTLLGCVVVFRDQSEERLSRHTLEESERRYRELFEVNPHAMWVYDDETLAFLAVNNAALARYGYSRDEFLAMTLADIRPPEDVAAMQADAAAMPDGFEGGRRWRHRRKDGTLLWVEIASHSLRWEGRQARMVLALDVTAQVGVETRLAWQADLLARLASGEPLARLLEALAAFVGELCPGVMSTIMLADPAAGVLRTAATHGVPLEVARAADPTPIRKNAGVCGTAAAQGSPFVVEDIEPSPAFDDYRAVTRAHGLRAAWSQPFSDSKGQTLGTVAMYRRAVGPPTTFEREVSGFATALAGIVVERARALDALHEREARLRAIFEHEPECVKVLDAQGRLLEMNPAGLRLIEADSIGQVKGVTVGDLVTPEYRARFKELTRHVAAGGEGQLEFEIVGLKGTRRWLETHVAPLQDSTGQVTAVLGVTRDVSRQKALAAELLQAQKLESVALLAGGVAHDFNNMLGVIQGQIELALESLPPGSPAIERLEQALDAAGKSAALTRQLLAFARREPASPRVLDVNARLDAVIGMLTRLIGEGVVVSWQPGAGVWPIRFDPSQLDQVIANLAINARDAMQGRGVLTIRTRNLPQARIGEATVDGVELTISDTGMGMDETTRARIFEPFFTTKPLGQGTGLGLATVYGVVRQHGGVVDVDSRPGAGSTFRIRLPRCEDAVLPAEAIDVAPPAAASAGGECVLVVEDEPALLTLVTTVLRRHGYTVVAAANAEAAEAVVQNHSGEFHLLLTDMIMPGRNGHQLWMHLRERCPRLRCLLMSGYTPESHGMAAIDVPILSKPFSLLALAEAVRGVLDGPPPQR